MFGYIVPNQEALSEEDHTLYREYYCGLCSMTGTEDPAR